MDWIKIIQAALSLSPVVLDLISSIVTAINNAPAEHKDAVVQKVAALAKTATE